ncbi:GTPase-activating protein [Pseudidiomarina aestuarii]|uniref:GTPase-activating protein n=1 Tax=Pseudidiomarina aestuarii TaxID=624146 RepID=A0A7Z7EUT1_9GAMM|nr:Der GTPase-activating protein YihI [Pseudidiomarina aestuarii]RUO42084.1 GTPase-activating protein [Pseudidiomarina aestuarii]
MTRRKKTRTTGPLAPSKKPLEPKSKKAPATRTGPHKGHKPGSRFNVAAAKPNTPSSAKSSTDPRHGSKKPIKLVDPNQVTPTPARQKLFDRAAALAELNALQNDARLQKLLAKLEADQELTPSELEYVDLRTDRFNQLAEQLGIEIDDEDDEDFDGEYADDEDDWELDEDERD